MENPRRVPAALVLAILAGCGSPQPPLSPVTPHGGMIFDLPDAKGSVEIVREPVADQPGRARLLLYFLDAELKPMAGAPTVATLKPRGRGATPIEMRAAADNDPAKAGVLICPNVAGQGDLSGELTVTVAGKPATLSVSVR